MIEFDADTIKDVISRAKSVILMTGGALTRIFEMLISKYLENSQSELLKNTSHSIAYALRNMQTDFQPWIQAEVGNIAKKQIRTKWRLIPPFWILMVKQKQKNIKLSCLCKMLGDENDK